MLCLRKRKRILLSKETWERADAPIASGVPWRTFSGRRVGGLASRYCAGSGALPFASPRVLLPASEEGPPSARGVRVVGIPGRITKSFKWDLPKPFFRSLPFPLSKRVGNGLLLKGSGAGLYFLRLVSEKQPWNGPLFLPWSIPPWDLRVETL